MDIKGIRWERRGVQTGSDYVHVSGSFTGGNEPSGSKRCREYLDQL